MRIFIVDDNERVRRAVIDVLSLKADWEICGQAMDGSEAILKAAELRPDVILLDISMPGMSGLEAARAIRKNVAEAKILMMSQYDPDQVLPRAIEAGAHGCGDKSRVATDLVPMIEKMIDRENSTVRAVA